VRPDVPASCRVAVDGAQDRQEGRGHDVLVDADAVTAGGVLDAHLDVGRRTGIGAGADGVFLVVHHAGLDTQRVHKGRDRAVALARKMADLAVDFQLDLDHELLLAGGLGAAGDAVPDQLHRRFAVQVFAGEDLEHVLGRDFAARLVGDALDGAAEFDLQAARQDQAVFLFEQEGHAALAGLAVDADDGVVAAAQVGRVDGQVRYFPRRVGLLHREALLDGILVRAGKSREDQVAGGGVARVHGQLVAVLHAAADFVDVGEIQARVDALGVQVQRQGDQVHIAGALAVAEQAPFDAVGPGHDGEFGGGHGRAPVVVGVNAEDDLVALGQMGVHPFDLVGVQVRRGGLDRGRQVQDDLVLDGRLPGVDHGVADFQREIGLGRAEDFRRIFVAPVGFGVLGDFGLDHPGAFDGDGADLVAAHAEDDLAEGRRARVVHADDGVPCACGCLDGALDQVFTGLGQGDDGDVVGDAVFVDQLAHEI